MPGHFSLTFLPFSLSLRVVVPPPAQSKLRLLCRREEARAACEAQREEAAAVGAGSAFSWPPPAVLQGKAAAPGVCLSFGEKVRR